MNFALVGAFLGILYNLLAVDEWKKNKFLNVAVGLIIVVIAFSVVAAPIKEAKAYPNFIDEDRFSEAAALFPFIQRLLFKLEGQEAVTEIEIIKEEIDKSFKDLKF